MTSSPLPKVESTQPPSESRHPWTLPARFEPKIVSIALASDWSNESTVSTKSKNRRATAPTGSVNTFAKKFTNAAIKFQSTAKTSTTKLISVTNRFPIKAAPTINAPQITPVAEMDVPANLFIAPTAA